MAGAAGGLPELHYQSQFHSNRRYGGDWYYKFGERDGFLRLGVDTVRTYGGQAGLLPLVGLRLPLPHRQVLEITYLRDLSTQILQLHLGGKLISPHGILRDSRGNPRINVRTSISGTVYTDLNYNGAFDGADRGIADVQVWLGSICGVAIAGIRCCHHRSWTFASQQ